MALIGNPYVNKENEFKVELLMKILLLLLIGAMVFFWI